MKGFVHVPDLVVERIVTTTGNRLGATKNQGNVLAMQTWTRRAVSEALDMWATLSVENGQRVVRGRCMLGQKTCNLHSAQAIVLDATHKTGLVLSTRFVLDSPVQRRAK